MKLKAFRLPMAATAVAALTFGLITLPGGDDALAAPVTENRSVAHQCVEDRGVFSQGPDTTVSPDNLTMTFPREVHPDETFTVSIQPGTMTSRSKRLGSMKYDIELPQGVAISNLRISGVGTNLRDVAPEVTRVGDDGHNNPNGRYARIWAEQRTVNNGPQTDDTRGGVDKGMRVATHQTFRLPQISFDVTAPDTAGATITSGLRAAGNGAGPKNNSNTANTLSFVAHANVADAVYCTPDANGRNLTSTRVVPRGTETSFAETSTDLEVTSGGGPTTLTANVTHDNGSPVTEGEVEFDFGDGSPTVTVPVNNGVATVEHTYPELDDRNPVGHTATARYLGVQGRTNPSEDATTVTVNPEPREQVQATVDLTGEARADQAADGQIPVELRAAVGATDGQTLPEGTEVVFYRGDEEVGRATATNGVATTTVNVPDEKATLTFRAVVADFETETQEVTGAEDTTSIDVAPVSNTSLSLDVIQPVKVGEDATITATYSATPSVPAGTEVTFLADGAEIGTATVNAEGVATLNHAFDAAGEKSITAVVEAREVDGRSYPRAESEARTLTVSQQGTSTNFAETSTDLEVTSGSSPTTLTANVTLDDGSPVTEGNVEFDFGDGSPTVTVPVVDGVATVEHTYPELDDRNPVPHTATARYLGVEGRTNPSQDTTTVTVNPVPREQVQATVALTGDAKVDEVADGRVPVELRATVGAADGKTLPEGVEVIFYQGTDEVGRATVTDGIATTTVDVPDEKATLTFRAVVEDMETETQELTGAEATTDVEVAPVATTSVILSGDESVKVGEDATITATYSATPSIPAGTEVTFLADGAEIGTATVGADGIATLTHAFDTAGAKSITAVVEAREVDGRTYPRAEAQARTLTVTEQGTSTNFAETSTDLEVTSGSGPTTLTANVTLDDGSPVTEGEVEFDFGDGSPTVTVPVNDGVATAEHTYPELDDRNPVPYQATARYLGVEGRTNPSEDTTSVTVNPVPRDQVQATVSLAAEAKTDEIADGQVPVELRATVGAEGDAELADGVEVVFYEGDEEIGRAATVDGVASLNTTVPDEQGTRTFRAVVENFETETQEVTGAEDTTSIDVAPVGANALSVELGEDGALVGQQATITATYSATPPVPAGTEVTFLADGAEIGTATVGADGVATLTHAFDTAGAKSITAVVEAREVDGRSYPRAESEAAMLTVAEPADQETTTDLTYTTPDVEVDAEVVTGDLIRFTATVDAGESTLEEGATMSFFDGDTLLGTVPVDPATGQAVFEHRFDDAGEHQVRAVFSGQEKKDEEGVITEVIEPSSSDPVTLDIKDAEGTDPGTDPGEDPGTDPGTDPGEEPGDTPTPDPGIGSGSSSSVGSSAGDFLDSVVGFLGRLGIIGQFLISIFGLGSSR
ncbi:MAG TPA: Ig-like domain-containing protein [Corynebacterium pollutisoli]|nr:Ig-like domain-containing protein [Corynebacterium pollutisoli]